MQTLSYRRTKFACFFANFTMSSVFCLPPLLFVTFHRMYGISWTLLGTLVLVNFGTQLAVDLLFTLFSKYFPIQKIFRVMPLITALGWLIYGIFPALFPHIAYMGLLIGTVVFSVAAGLSEVLISPTIAALPSDNPQRDMGFLHSLYAFGVVSVVLVSTLFLKFAGSRHWMYLTLFFAALPATASALLMWVPLPDMGAKEAAAKAQSTKRKSIGIALCVGCIFFGSCAENAMSNWMSGFLETQLHLDKTVGDILGMALFAVLLGITRICYAKWGKNICRTLLIGMFGAAVCYLVAGLSAYAVPALIACVLSGVFTAMLWPGTLIMMEENIPGVRVAAYALMAVGGDFGSSVAPQLVGMVADRAGLQTGLLLCSIFPVLGVILMLVIIRFFKRNTF